MFNINCHLLLLLFEVIYFFYRVQTFFVNCSIVSRDTLTILLTRKLLLKGGRQSKAGSRDPPVAQVDVI